MTTEERIKRLNTLKQLLDDGVLSQEEVEQEKQKILYESEPPSPSRTDLSEFEDEPNSEDSIMAPKRHLFLIGLALAALVICLAVYFTNRQQERFEKENYWEEYIETEAAAEAAEEDVFSGSQNVFTLVYATSNDGFVNVRSEPSNNGTILTRLDGMFWGLGSGILLEKGESWSKVSVGGSIGWCYNKYLGYQTWYTGTGTHTLVSLNDNTPIYGEDFSGEGHLPVFARIGKGVIIADEYEEDGRYYVLVTANEPLYVSKDDVSVR